MLNDAVTAFALLTRLPVSRFSRGGAPDLARAVWAFPLVGLVVGLAGGLVYGLGHRLGLPPFLAASWAVAAMLLVTGAFHEDGLADTADGFGGGSTRERKLEIMRDSRIGTYGALALGLSLFIRVGALASIGKPPAVITALIVAAMLGRGGIVILLVVLKPTRQDGMAATLRDIPGWCAAFGLVLAFTAPFLCLSPKAAFVAVAATVLSCLAVAKLAHTQIGGHSGDVLGAGEVIVECAVLSAIAAVLA